MKSQSPNKKPITLSSQFKSKCVQILKKQPDIYLLSYFKDSPNNNNSPIKNNNKKLQYFQCPTLLFNLSKFKMQNDLCFLQIMLMMKVNKIILFEEDKRDKKNRSKNKINKEDIAEVEEDNNNINGNNRQSNSKNKQKQKQDNNKNNNLVKKFSQTHKFKQFLKMISNKLIKQTQQLQQQEQQQHQKLLTKSQPHLNTSKKIYLNSLILQKIESLPIKSLKQLSNGIQKSKNLRQITFKNCQLTDQHLFTLKNALSKCVTLKSLNLMQNELRDVGGMIGKIISSHGQRRNQIKYIYQIRNELPQFNLQEMGLCEINLQNNKLISKSIIDLVAFLKYDRWIRSINLRKNNVLDDGIIQLIKLLKDNQSLMNLDLRQNEGLKKQYERYLLKRLKCNIIQYKENKEKKQKIRQEQKKSQEKNRSKKKESIRNSINNSVMNKSPSKNKSSLIYYGNHNDGSKSNREAINNSNKKFIIMNQNGFQIDSPIKNIQKFIQKQQITNPSHKKTHLTIKQSIQYQKQHSIKLKQKSKSNIIKINQNNDENHNLKQYESTSITMTKLSSRQIMGINNSKNKKHNKSRSKQLIRFNQNQNYYKNQNQIKSPLKIQTMYYSQQQYKKSNQQQQSRQKQFVIDQNMFKKQQNQKKIPINIISAKDKSYQNEKKQNQNYVQEYQNQNQKQHQCLKCKQNLFKTLKLEKQNIELEIQIRKLKWRLQKILKNNEKMNQNKEKQYQEDKKDNKQDKKIKNKHGKNIKFENQSKSNNKIQQNSNNSKSDNLKNKNNTDNNNSNNNLKQSSSYSFSQPLIPRLQSLLLQLTRIMQSVQLHHNNYTQNTIQNAFSHINSLSKTVSLYQKGKQLNEVRQGIRQDIDRIQNSQQEDSNQYYGIEGQNTSNKKKNIIHLGLQQFINKQQEQNSLSERKQHNERKNQNSKPKSKSKSKANSIIKIKKLNQNHIQSNEKLIKTSRKYQQKKN